jgi:PAS domain-containing protein
MCHTMLIEDSERMQLQDFFRQSEQEYLDLLESVADSVTILTPEGLVLEIHEHSSTSAPIRREAAIGKPLTEFLSWSAAPFAQEQLRTAIAQASRGETARFEARYAHNQGSVQMYQ